jgi:hypothetical protein
VSSYIGFYGVDFPSHPLLSPSLVVYSSSIPQLVMILRVPYSVDTLLIFSTLFLCLYCFAYALYPTPDLPSEKERYIPDHLKMKHSIS